jgi:hypothetical protein
VPSHVPADRSANVRHIGGEFAERIGVSEAAAVSRFALLGEFMSPCFGEGTYRFRLGLSCAEVVIGEPCVSRQGFSQNATIEAWVESGSDRKQVIEVHQA